MFRVGWPERLVDRSLERGHGDERARLRGALRSQAASLFAVLLGLLVAAVNLSTGSLGPQGVWALVGVAWLGIGHMNVRQRRYVRRLLDDEVS